MHASPNALKNWIWAARPKTLIAGVSPVIIGAAVAGRSEWAVIFLCLLFSMAVQIGANLANDYFDYIKGADTSERVGPPRAAQSEWISLPALRNGIIAIFIFAACISIPLLIRIGWIAACLMPFCIMLAVLYTGGPRPLGYLGLGELLVFIFYGPVATIGTYYAMTLQFDSVACFASLSPGLLSCAILIANNLRDEESDRKADKKTLVVRFGRKFGRWEYFAAIALAAMIPFFLAALGLVPKTWIISAFILPLAYPSLKRAFTAKTAHEFVPLLPMSALLLYFYTALFLIATLW